MHLLVPYPDITTRVEAAWDRYIEASFMSLTRAKQELLNKCLSKDTSAKWSLIADFPENCQNKDELFQFISQEHQRNTAD